MPVSGQSWTRPVESFGVEACHRNIPSDASKHRSTPRSTLAGNRLSRPPPLFVPIKTFPPDTTGEPCVIDPSAACHLMFFPVRTSQSVGTMSDRSCKYSPYQLPNQRTATLSSVAVMRNVRRPNWNRNRRGFACIALDRRTITNCARGATACPQAEAHATVRDELKKAGRELTVPRSRATSGTTISRPVAVLRSVRYAHPAKLRQIGTFTHEPRDTKHPAIVENPPRQAVFLGICATRLGGESHFSMIC